MMSKQEFVKKVAAAMRIEADRIERDGDFGDKINFITPVRISSPTSVWSNLPKHSFTVDYLDTDSERVSAGLCPFLMEAMSLSALNMSDNIDW